MPSEGWEEPHTKTRSRVTPGSSRGRPLWSVGSREQAPRQPRPTSRSRVEQGPWVSPEARLERVSRWGTLQRPGRCLLLHEHWEAYLASCWGPQSSSAAFLMSCQGRQLRNYLLQVLPTSLLVNLRPVWVKSNPNKNTSCWIQPRKESYSSGARSAHRVCWRSGKQTSTPGAAWFMFPSPTGTGKKSLPEMIWWVLSLTPVPGTCWFQSVLVPRAQTD